MLLASLYELKTYLDIDPNDTSEDKLLNYYAEISSEWLEELVGRKIAKRSRTEYLDGSGTRRLLLTYRPVYTTPTIQCWVDDNGAYGQTTDAFATALTYGTNFALQIDQEDGTSRSAILHRLDGYWPKRVSRQVGTLSPFLTTAYGAVKVTYTAGWSTDNLPAPVRLAYLLLIARLRSVLPLGVELTGDNFDDRSISVVTNNKTRLLDLIRPVMLNYRNWKW